MPVILSILTWDNTRRAKAVGEKDQEGMRTVHVVLKKLDLSAGHCAKTSFGPWVIFSLITPDRRATICRRLTTQSRYRKGLPLNIK
jgi:hypothetical protein